MTRPRDEIAAAMHDPRVVDAEGELVDRADLSPAEVDQVVAVMNALRDWHEAAERMNAASQRYMKLNQTDMRAVRYLIAAHNQQRLVTPGALTRYLGISSASTTKLLDRLEHGDHVVRSPHPTDRRAVVVAVTDATRVAARESTGRQHARRFTVAARLSPAERDVVIGFLAALSATERAVEASADSTLPVGDGAGHDDE
ncbi:MarR family winged helix-turn-helix transcriptional regulator [Propionibacteriaceae bacterium Y2011]|uniref:MarR family winged helix-turn-helix transcriptional regulator n=1 Tax=Microlunatus sp. Y2014 TaxID=3418488 RepID=UPI003B4AA771